ncbi:helicase and polymerase-containing protein TEBICHI [Salvia miltiorrhiza]|uniref:helicase and polymerase-containing protein TEBICHI n=1 Tax=Salvia miltiorrhiza TaxID=226208 RepID=UPI0025ABD75B|nr:helicase and polymerase-containing protein TEBICHI [Salvia miltiorrhiza]
MDSDSTRARIDQFFSSKKKRKFVSPASKSDRPEKEAKTQIECSPNAKGSLVSYLETSPAKCVNSASDEKTRPIPVKRNLILEADRLLSKDDNEGALHWRPQCSEASGAAPTMENESLSVIANNAVEGARKDSSVMGALGRSSNLKQFTNSLLSLYCGGLQSSVNLPSETKEIADKRHCSRPSALQLEEETSGRRHCENPSKTQNESFSSPKGGRLKNAEGPADIGFNHLEKDVAQPSLRKCNNITALSTAECETPASFPSKLGARETPQSTRGSSSFSPGDAFWNEAILVADGITNPNADLSSHVAETNEALKVDFSTRNSNNVKDRGCVHLLNSARDGVTHSVSDFRAGSAMGSPGMHLDKEVSPLPVKHFDFSLEAKHLDKEIPADANKTKPDILTTKETLVSINQRNSQCYTLTCSSSKDQINSKRSVEDLKENIHDVAYITPNSDYKRVVANELKSDCTPASSLVKGCLDLSNWLPLEICQIYYKKGISKLYPWQVDCLQVEGVLHNRNLVYCASTSAGKSFVAEILMLRRVLATGKIALLVLPYVSICSEKAEHLEVLLEPVGKHVRSFYGNQGGGSLPKDTSVAVCTIEKANSLINRLLEEGRLSELGTIVIDELHMVGDQSRGYLLELLLTKLRYAAGEGNVESSSGENSGSSSGKSDAARGLQIIGMSATLPNVSAVADWLQAALYETEFRPVPLEEFIKIESTIYNKEMEIVRTIPKVAALGGKDPDHIVELCNEVVQEGHSVLIFCSSRKGCESTAKHIAKYLKGFCVNPRGEQGEPFDIAFAIDSLRRSPAGLDPILNETLPFGVAYHHAGLTVEERETVEMCYRKGLVRVLTATSTLAAGVNLPARRVIFRQPRIGRDFIDGTRYRQMAGRAGRTGIDTKGESVLICKPEEAKKILALLNDSCPPLHSCLSEDRNGMTHAILEVVAGGIVQTANDIHRYVRCTLLNSTKPFEDVVKSAQDSLRWLCHRKFLEWSDETKLYTTTPLGRASFGSSLCPEESLIVLDDLMRAREGFVLASDLHLVYLVTPINVDVEPDWELYYERYMQLSSLDQSVGNRVGVKEPFLMRMAHGAPSRFLHRSRDSGKSLQGKYDHKPGTLTHGVLSDEQMLRMCKRFYIALILARLVQEVPVGEVCEGFKVARGMVQALQENAGRFASMVSVFCERLGWHDLESLVAKFQHRVSFGVRAEIVELTAIPFIKGSRARALYRAGLRTPQAIAEASIPEIAKALFESSSWSGQDMEGAAQRKIQMGVAKKIKNGARKIVLEKAEEARVAAFSAFKSLGLDVSQLSRPLEAPRKEPASSSEEESTSSYAFLQHSKNILDSPSVVVRRVEGDQPIDPLPAGSVEENSAGNAGGKMHLEKCVLIEHTTNPVNGKIHITNNCTSNPKGFAPDPSTDIGGVKRQLTENIDHVGEQLPENKNICMGSRVNKLEKGPVSVISIPGGVDSFLDLLDATTEFFFDIHFTKKSELNSTTPFEIHGIAICWEDSPVYYLSIPKDISRYNSKQDDHSMGSKDVLPLNMQVEIAKKRWTRFGAIMGKMDVRKFTWNLKVQIQVLKRPAASVHKFSTPHGGIKSLGLDLIDNSYFMFSPAHVRNAIDLCVVAWILSPDEEKSSSPNLEKEAKRRLSSDAAASTNRSGRWKDQTRRAAHNGCCRRVAQTRALSSILWKLLHSEELIEPLITVEVRLVNILADMEILGIGVDMEGCLRARQVLGKKLKLLEKEAYRLAGKTFSLSMPADIANILYEHLNLPMPEGYEGKNHHSTDKHCLELLRDEHLIVPVIKEHRTLSKLFNSTLGSICSLARLSVRAQKYTLHGRWLQTSTATGRLSMEEPNLQCVEHMVEFKTNEVDGESCASHYKINARDFFVPTQDDWVLLTADYCQIELRLMAHFSKDYSLIELLTSPQADVFTMIAAKWSEKHESSVSSQDRERTKRLVYGILYGMGPNTLAEQLDCSADEAAERIQNFKKSFPGVASWLQEAVTSCHKKGYVKTLKGRKRFLSNIKFGNSKEKSKAQRQAVNSICQGSAADIIKIAMICLHDVIGDDSEAFAPSFIDAEKFQLLKGRCRILLQVHDELVLEADPSIVKEAGLLLQTCMERAVSLLVPLPVKIKLGKTWGSLEPFDPNC